MLPDLTRLLAGVNALPETGLLIVANNGASLLVVGNQALLEGLSVVIAALDKRLAGDIVGHGLLRGVECCVVGSARGRVDETAGDTLDKESIIDLQLNNVLESLLALLEHGVEAFGLGNGSGEAIKDETAGKESQRNRSFAVIMKGNTYPPWHSLLVSSSALIMPMTISSLTRPPWSMIFLASRPRSVFLAI